MSKPSLVIVLIEDDHHKMLLYRYLDECGLKHKIRFQQSPSGRGSADSWVRKSFVKEVMVYRNRSHKARTALIVIIDADTRTVQDRWNQFDQALRDSGEETVAHTEPIARLVPKRNVETWVLCLNEQAVDEKTDYTKTRDDWNDLIPKASHALYQWTRPQAELPTFCIASLRAGVHELKQLAF